MACNGTHLSIGEKMKNKEREAKNWTDTEDEGGHGRTEKDTLRKHLWVGVELQYKKKEND